MPLGSLRVCTVLIWSKLVGGRLVAAICCCNLCTVQRGSRQRGSRPREKFFCTLGKVAEVWTRLEDSDCGAVSISRHVINSISDIYHNLIHTLESNCLTSLLRWQLFFFQTKPSMELPDNLIAPNLMVYIYILIYIYIVYTYTCWYWFSFPHMVIEGCTTLLDKTRHFWHVGVNRWHFFCEIQSLPESKWAYHKMDGFCHRKSH